MYEVTVVYRLRYRKGKGYVVGAGDYRHDRIEQEEVHAVRVAGSSGGG